MADMYDRKGKRLGSPTFCPEHWDMLRNEITRQGLASFVAEDGMEAGRKLKAMHDDGVTVDNFEPLLAANLDATLLAVKHGGADGCPIEFLAVRYESSPAEVVERLVDEQKRKLPEPLS
jgi:hypothetical protein